MVAWMKGDEHGKSTIDDMMGGALVFNGIDFVADLYKSKLAYD
jgi:hypothetical protein